MSHKYTLGQGVVFSPGPGEIVRGNARGKVTRLLPKEDASYQYCIQLEVEDQERRVQESQLWSPPEAGAPARPQQAGNVSTGRPAAGQPEALGPGVSRNGKPPPLSE